MRNVRPMKSTDINSKQRTDTTQSQWQAITYAKIANQIRLKPPLLIKSALLKISRATRGPGPFAFTTQLAIQQCFRHKQLQATVTVATAHNWFAIHNNDFRGDFFTAIATEPTGLFVHSDLCARTKQLALTSEGAHMQEYFCVCCNPTLLEPLILASQILRDCMNVR